MKIPLVNRRNELKILHIWDVAGVSSCLTKYLRKHGIESDVLMRGGYLSNSITHFYGNKVLYQNPKKFSLQVILKSRNYDIIHVHSTRPILKWVKILAKKPTILHYHGSEVRDFSIEERKEEKFADKIIVSTEDLLENRFYKDPTYLPNIVDTELFSKKEFPKNNEGFVRLKKNQTVEQTQKLLKENGFDIKLESINYNQLIHFAGLIDFLKYFQWYVDLPIINCKIIKANSLLGLQCMSMGMEVICHDFQVRSKIPEENQPQQVLEKLIPIYEELVKK